MSTISIVVCEGDQTGQELLNEALRVLDPSVLGFDVDLIRFDLSLANRQTTDNQVVRGAAAAMVETGLGLKAATITPTEIGSVGSPNRILREGIGGKVIVRTGRRIPGVAPVVSLSHPVVVVRMAVGDAYGAAEGRDGEPGSPSETAWRTERIDRGVCQSVAEFAFATAASMDGLVYGGPKWTVSAIYEGMLKEEMDRAASRHPDVVYHPMLIDAAYAGLMTEQWDRTVVQGKNVANPMAMLLACAAVLEHAGIHGDERAAEASRTLRSATLAAAMDGLRTFDLGGSASTSEVVDEVVLRMRSR